MKHKWEKEPDVRYTDYEVFKEWVCKRCGARKSLSWLKFSTPMYIRNGQIYQSYIECMDYDAELLKTID